MKKVFSVVAVLLVVAFAAFALDFSSVDTRYVKDGDIHEIYNDLQGMLKKASTDQEKSEVLWRLARICVSLGDELDESDKTGRFAVYEEGEAYADKAIEIYPSAMAYLWKCSCIGRWGQTKGIMDSLSKSKPMMANLKEVTDTYGCVDSSEAWYVLAVLYSSLPGIFGGDSNAAISYARVACDTITSDVIYLGTYMELADQLYERNWTAKKRASEIAKMQNSWNKTTSSNYEKYKYYEGKGGADASPMWTKTKLSAMSDRQEALAILQYAKLVYESRSFHTSGDDENYAKLLEKIAKMS